MPSAVDAGKLFDELWELCQLCWLEPSARPDATKCMKFLSRVESLTLESPDENEQEGPASSNVASRDDLTIDIDEYPMQQLQPDGEEDDVTTEFSDDETNYTSSDLPAPGRLLGILYDRAGYHLEVALARAAARGRDRPRRNSVGPAPSIDRPNHRRRITTAVNAVADLSRDFGSRLGKLAGKAGFGKYAKARKILKGSKYWRFRDWTEEQRADICEALLNYARYVSTRTPLPIC